MELKTAPEYETPEELIQLWKNFRTEVIACLKKTPESEFTKNPAEGRWSISEIGEHLYLTQFNLARLIPVIIGRKFGDDFDEQPNLPYEKIRDTFYKPTGVKNPENVSPLNKYSLGEILELLDKSEKKTEFSLKKYSRSDLQKRGFDHPILGPLNIFNWLWVLALHEHSHLVALKDKTSKF